MITKLTSNIRAIARDLTFTKRISVIVGPNRSGKTSILDALALIFSGSIPRLGKINAKLASIIGWSGSASVTANFEDGKKSSFRLMGNPEDGYDKKQALCTEYLSKATFDARLFLNSGPTDRIAIIQASLGASAAGDVRQSAWSAATKAFEASGGEAGGIQSWSAKLFPTDMAEFTTAARKIVNAHIAATKARVEQYEGAFLTSLESSDVAPVYSAQSHTAAHRLLSELETCNRDNAKAINRLEGLAEQAERWAESERQAATIAEAELIEVNERIERIKNAIKIRKDDIAKLKANIAPCEHGSDIGPCPTCGRPLPEEIKPRTDEDNEIDELECAIEEDEGDLKTLEGRAQLLNRPPNDDKLKQEAEKHTAEAEALRALLVPDQQLDEASANLAEHEEAQKAYDSFMQRQKEEEDMVKARAQASSDLAAYEAAKKALDTELAAAASAVLGPVMGVANAVLQGILPYPLTNRGFSLGYALPEGVWVPIEGFSGSETEAALIGFTAGLASQEAFKVAIMDEAGMLDPVTFKQLLANIESVVAGGFLHQVFIAGTGFDIEESENIQVIKL